ncbi:Cof-type HAD-IIB family hydrolase [uncultured Lutibacter sp.]|uniref:Cof-type HAD-IIB family hydrolase n=1 Tax=uncultured Lutibacter sp. TaxID=437739 RepID=UPI00260EB180|nr:Cof-type HAD-IIB family hydrolase [uncultured Lutibacter sp.]
MNYKLICTDIDGTLLNKDRELSEITIKEVQRIAPIPFVLISSRMPKAMRHLQQQFNNTSTPIIAYNGGLILDNDIILHSTVIDNIVLEEIINQCSKTAIHLSLYYADEWYVPSMDFWAKREANNTKVTPTVKPNIAVLTQWKNEDKGAHKIMCMGDETEIEILYNSLEKSFSNEITLYRSKPTYIEISHKSISKKTAIEYLLKNRYSEISMENVIAFGDNYNDIEMLKSVGLGVAVANAKEEVLKIANKITDTNKNDGVAKTIEELF